MKTILLVAGAILCCAAAAQSPAGSAPKDSSKCPIGFEHVDLRYNHAGGESAPQLRVSFTNRTGKTIAGFAFSLAILDSNGNPIPYASQFEYHHDFPAGEGQRSRIWTLDPAAVDMHRSGESVTLAGVTFADGTTWKDDGSEACTLAFDYHAK
jgi:hypothetical protein